MKATTAAGSTSVVVFVDLDDSLFNSARKCMPGVCLEPAALLSNGEVVSYTNPRQRAMLHWLRQGATVIPVTARSAESFARVLVDFQGNAVVSFGGVILDSQRQPDARWAALMQPALSASYELLHEACATMSAWISQHRVDAWAKVIEEEGQAQYVLAKHRTADSQALASIAENFLKPWALHRPGWRVFQNDNNLTLLPPCLDKAHAVAFLMEQLQAANQDVVTIGLGDSLSDAGFLSLCDYAMAPKGTQLGQRLWDHMQ